MCLDPRPDRLARTIRPSRHRSGRTPVHAARLAPALHTSIAAPVIGAPAFWALDTLAGDDELVARGWVVLSRDN
jgi:hypothetical protein